MSAKSKFLIVVILSVFATTAVGLRLVSHQPPPPINTAKTTRQQPNLSVVMPVRNVVTNSEEDKYKTIPLESINYSLQGTDPASLAVNAFYNAKYKGKTRNVEVVYPQPNQALVTVTQIRPIGNNVEVMKYRARLSAFGRSLFVSSPPLWEIVWAGYQRQCWSSPVKNIQATSISIAC